MRYQFRDSQHAHLFAPSSLTQHLFFESDSWKHPQRLSNLTGQSSILYCTQFGLLHQFLGAATDWDWGFPGSSVVKNMPADTGDMGSIPELGRSPGERKWQLTPVFLPGKTYGQKSLVGYSPWGCKRIRHD